MVALGAPKLMDANAITSDFGVRIERSVIWTKYMKDT